MIDIDSPGLKLTLAIIGTAADVTALVIVISNAGHFRVPWWAVLLFLFGTLLIITSRSSPGDFRILRREVLLDIKSWDNQGGAPLDTATTYKFDRLKCRKLRGARYLIYPGYASDGQRINTDVVSYVATWSPTKLNPNAQDLSIDLGQSCSYGKKYTVISRSEYKGTFPNAQTEDYRVNVSYPMKLLRVTIILPPNKVCPNTWVTKTVGATTETDRAQPKTSDSKRVITWEKKRPDFNAKYQISWNW